MAITKRTIQIGTHEVELYVNTKENGLALIGWRYGKYPHDSVAGQYATVPDRPGIFEEHLQVMEIQARKYFETYGQTV